MVENPNTSLLMSDIIFVASTLDTYYQYVST